jgi:hypothetical protein
MPSVFGRSSAPAFAFNKKSASVFGYRDPDVLLTALQLFVWDVVTVILLLFGFKHFTEINDGHVRKQWHLLHLPPGI